MTVAATPAAHPGAGLPPGVRAGGLGARFAAQLVDLVVPAALINIAIAADALVVSIVCVVLLVAWVLVVWSMFAIGGAGPGMTLMKLQLVRLRNGRPIGWWRFAIRTLLLLVLTATGIGLLVLIFLLIGQRRNQGLHDLAVRTVVIAARPRTRQPRPVMDDELEEDELEDDELEDDEHTRVVESPVAELASTAVDDQPTESASSEVEPAGTEPAATEPAATEPAATEPAATEPAGTEAVTAAADLVSEASPDAPETLSGLPKEWSAEPRSGLPQAKAEGWQAVLDGEQTLDINRLILIGRNPQPSATDVPADATAGQTEAAAAMLIKVSDRARTVSKTHLALDVDADGPFAVDRESTNGSAVTDIDGHYRLLAAGEQVRLNHGDVIAFGDHRLEICHP